LRLVGHGLERFDADVIAQKGTEVLEAEVTRWYYKDCKNRQTPSSQKNTDE